MMDVSVALTADQRRLVEMPAQSRTLVTAPAGSGKTLALVHRIDQLCDEGELEPGEIVVLTFSRSAVREIRTRLRTHSGAASDVGARTFDSYATWLLSEVDPGGAWMAAGYDMRIREATKRLSAGDASALLHDARHVIIDEVQDLVGVRRQLVMALLSELHGGFTLLGDPAQSIYGFMAAKKERVNGTEELYRWLRTHFATAPLFEFTFTENFRAREPETRQVLPLSAWPEVLSVTVCEPG